MTDGSEFKSLVRRRMEATGEKYTDAHRALLDAARAEVLPLGHRVLPRVAARYEGSREPIAIMVELIQHVRLDLDESDLQAYLAGAEYVRDDLVRERLRDEIEVWIESEDLIRGHSMRFADQDADMMVRFEAEDLGITPDQYAWLSERLTEDEFSQLSDEAMHELIRREYTAYPPPSSAL